MAKTVQNRKQSPSKKKTKTDQVRRKPNTYNIFRNANKEKLAGMTNSEISLAYRQTLGSINWPNYEPPDSQSVDSDEEPVDNWMRTQKNTDDYDDRMRLDELAQFGTARQNAALKEAEKNNPDDNSEYDIENMTPQMLLSLAPYIGIWDKLSEEQIQSIVDTKSGLTLNGEAIMSSYKGRNSYRTPRKPNFVLLPSGERFYI